MRAKEKTTGFNFFFSFFFYFSDSKMRSAVPNTERWDFPRAMAESNTIRLRLSDYFQMSAMFSISARRCSWYNIDRSEGFIDSWLMLAFHQYYFYKMNPENTYIYIIQPRLFFGIGTSKLYSFFILLYVCMLEL